MYANQILTWILKQKFENRNLFNIPIKKDIIFGFILS